MDFICICLLYKGYFFPNLQYGTEKLFLKYFSKTGCQELPQVRPVLN